MAMLSRADAWKLTRLNLVLRRPWTASRFRLETLDVSVSDAGREDADPASPSPLLSRISNEMVSAQKEYFGRGPTKAKSYLLDDFLVVVMRGVLLPVEKTMLEAGKEDIVRQYRQDFQNAMTERLVGKIEELTGRKILTYQAQVLFDPDLMIELFFFDNSMTSEQVQEATGQLEWK